MADASTNFDEVFKSEIAAINVRRASLGREKITPPGQGEQREVIDAVGLALSGGGIRSAAFCLGALQGLDRAKLIDRLDYLSTVSGGGYIGSSLVAAMNVPKDTRTAATALKAEFPFESTLDLSETPSVQHLRDYSNYLFPHFVPDLLKGAAIYLRGLATNVVLVAPWMLLFAAISAILNQHLASWARSNYEGLWYNWFGLQHFVITSLAASALFVLLIVWALVRSTKAFVGLSDIRLFAGWFGAGIVLLLLIAILELQPIILEWMIVAEEQHRPVFAVDGRWLDRVPQVLAVFSTLVGLFSRYLAQVIGGATEQSGTGRKIAGALSIAMVWTAAAAVPFLIWVGYIYLTFWALRRPQKSIEFFAPDWMQHYAISLFGGQFWAVAGLYILVAIVLIVISCFLNPNANSLHRLYRDRLSKAFLFKPNEIDPTTKELLPQDGLRLSEIKTPLTPYPLINTAINLQASKTANRRGRNADFFVLSPRYVGSEATGYCSTNVMEELTKDLDLGTALAISGAAASSNMGANSIKILAPTLALLNIRLGYWLRNPMYAGGSRASKLLDRIDLYFLFEMFGFLGERSRLVYLTDGGHIENLGMYELLKRKCRIIVTVDAEADPAMNSGHLAFCSGMRASTLVYASICRGKIFARSRGRRTQRWLLISSLPVPTAHIALSAQSIIRKDKTAI
jgi:hypothetical protein